MRRHAWLVAVLVAGLVALTGAEPEGARNSLQPEIKDSGMAELSDFTLMNFLAEGDVFWTACALTDPSCGNSRAMIEAACRFLEAQKGTERELPVRLGYFDTSLYDLPYELEQLPAAERPPMVPLLHYRDGAYYAQTAVNLRDSPYALLDFIFNHHQRGIRELANREELRAFVEENEVAAHSSLVIFGGEEGDQAHRTVLSVVQDYPDIYALAAIYDEELARAELGEEYEEGAVRVYCHFEHEHADHVVPVLTNMHAISRPDMTEWLHTWASRHVAMFSPKLLPVMLTKFPMAVLVVAPREDAAATELMLNAVNAAAEAHPDVGFTFSDVPSASPTFLYDGASGKVFPTAVVLFANPKSRAFAFDESEEFTADALVAWVDALKSRTAMPFLKSAPVPDYDGVEEGGIKEVVFDNFDQTVLATEDRVLVLVTAPTEHCRECKGLREFVQQAMPEFSEGVSVVQYDVVDNCAGVFEQYSLPELRLYYKGKFSTFAIRPSLTPKDDLVMFVNKHHRQSKMKRGRRGRHDEL